MDKVEKITETETRKVSDILLSLEEKIIVLMKSISLNEMNNKLILDRLNKLVSQQITANKENIITPIMVVDKPTPTTPIEMAKTPPKLKRQPVNNQSAEKNKSKIPVAQRITNAQGKDVFMADVEIYDDKNDLIEKIKTNTIGKWQAYLQPGNYIIKISKIINPETKERLEKIQEIKIDAEMKSSQLSSFSLS